MRAISLTGCRGFANSRLRPLIGALLGFAQPRTGVGAKQCFANSQLRPLTGALLGFAQPRTGVGAKQCFTNSQRRPTTADSCRGVDSWMIMAFNLLRPVRQFREFQMK